MDNSDLPAGYRWATADEAQRWEQIPGAIVVPLTADASGQPYTHDEADIAVPLIPVPVNERFESSRLGFTVDRG